jgi:hypothetical protein
VSYQRGDLVELRIETKNKADALTDPTTLTLRLKSPAGAESAKTWSGGQVSKEATGIFFTNVLLSEGGTWTYRWEATGTVELAEDGELEAESDDFETAPAAGTRPFTYDLNTDIGKVRFEIPDTTEDGRLLDDAEIVHALNEENGFVAAAARCCETIARRFAMQADIATGDVKITYSKQAENLSERAKDLRKRVQGAGIPFAGGVSRTDKENRALDEDRVQGAFSRGQFDNPDAGL